MNLTRISLLADFLLRFRVSNPHQFQETIDSLLEGVQIHDFNWKYLYVNDSLISYSQVPKEGMLNRTLYETYPGIEKSNLFKILDDCMTQRVSNTLETEFKFPNGTSSYFELSIQPIPEGLFILSIDRTEQKIAKEKLLKVNRLYAFTSAINKSILQISNEEILLKNTCEVAVTIGQFLWAYIGMFDAYNNLQLVCYSGDTLDAHEILLRSGWSVEDTQFMDFPIGEAIRTKNFYCINDTQSDPSMESWRDVLKKHGIMSTIAMPIIKFGKVVGILGLHSRVKDFFDEDEINLLLEATDDVSFALENFERARKHQEVEERILKNEKRFRALIEKSSDMKTLSTLEGVIMYGSPSIFNVLGYELSEFLHRPVFDFIHPSEVEELKLQIVSITQESGKYAEFKYRFLHKVGHWVWCEGILTNMLDVQGINAIVSNFRDISDKIVAEENLAKSEEFSKGILRSLTAQVAVVDEDGYLIAVNEAWERFSTENGQPVLGTWGIGKNYFQVCEKAYEEGNSTAKKILEGLKDVLSGRKQIFYLEYPCHLPQSQQWFGMRVLKFDSKINMAVITQIDITERKLYEHVMLQNYEELRKTNHELDRFVYSASHDLRAPLTTILGVLNFIEVESSEANILNYASMIKSSVNRLDNVIKNIINYSKNNRNPVENNLISVEETLKGICEWKRADIELAGIEMDMVVNETVAFHSDLKRFEIIIQNVLTNAIKFQDNSKLEKRIWITAKVNSEMLSISIKDNGIGIPKEYQHKIFEMFFRISGKIPGSGIGLYIVSEAIEKLQGSIQVDSVLGEGSEFQIMIPNLTA